MRQLKRELPEVGGAELEAHAALVRRKRAARERRRGVLEKWREQRQGLVRDAVARFEGLVAEERARRERDAERTLAEARRLGASCPLCRVCL